MVFDMFKIGKRQILFRLFNRTILYLFKLLPGHLLVKITSLCTKSHSQSQIFGTKYSRMDQVKFVETTFKKFEAIWSDRLLGRPYQFKFFKGCLLQILLCLFLNALSQLSMHTVLQQSSAIPLLNKQSFSRVSFSLLQKDKGDIWGD